MPNNESVLKRIDRENTPDWVRQVWDPRLDTVAEHFPRPFESYLRLYHPFTFWDDESTLAPVTWRSLATETGVDFNKLKSCSRCQYRRNGVPT